jgi:hypothetical protein
VGGDWSDRSHPAEAGQTDAAADRRSLDSLGSLGSLGGSGVHRNDLRFGAGPLEAVPNAAAGASENRSWDNGARVAGRDVNRLLARRQIEGAGGGLVAAARRPEKPEERGR